MASTEPKKDFVKHVFDMGPDSKAELMNIAQYSTLCIAPLVVVNRAIGAYMPDADDSKSSAEIVAELVAQTVFLFVSLVFCHRLVTFVPTYSGEPYPAVQIFNGIICALAVLLSMQSKLGDKARILADRVHELWAGPAAGAKKTKPARASPGSSAGFMDTAHVTPTAPPQQQQQHSAAALSDFAIMQQQLAADIDSAPEVQPASSVGGVFGSAW